MVVVYLVLLVWMFGQCVCQIVDMIICIQYDGDLLEDIVWIMFSEFEKGFWLIIYYQDWYNFVDKVVVGFNVSNFMLVYQEFVSCVLNLLFYSFEDISYMVLSYEKNSVELFKYFKKCLVMIGDYL